MIGPRCCGVILSGTFGLLATACESDMPLRDAPSVINADLHVMEGVTRLAGPDGTPLFGVSSATILRGQVIIAESSASRLLAYSPDGELLSTLGRGGSGPGEFQSVGMVQAVGGRLRVFDRTLWRITEFDEDGVLTATVNLLIPAPFATGDVVGFLADGRSVVLLSRFPVPVKSGKVVRRTGILAVFDSAGAFVNTLATVPVSEVYAEPYGRAGERQIVIPFGKRTGVVTIGTTVAISDGTDWAIRLIDADTRITFSLTPPGSFVPKKLPAPHLALIREQRRDVNRDIRRFLGRAGVPDYLPPYGWAGLRPVAPLVAAADDGSLWVAMVTGPGEGARWRVFGGAADIRIAASSAPVELLAVNGGIAVTKRYDSNDVEFIEVSRVHGGPHRRSTKEPSNSSESPNPGQNRPVHFGH